VFALYILTNRRLCPPISLTTRLLCTKKFICGRFIFSKKNNKFILPIKSWHNIFNYICINRKITGTMNEILIGIFYLVLIAFLITFFFTFLLRKRGPWDTFWTFFIIIFLAVLAANLWIGPVGPHLFDEIYWVPPLIVGLLIALLLAATSPPPKTRSELEIQKKELAEGKKATAVLGTFFWFLFAFMMLLIIAGIINEFYYEY
jgi:hypothetical protein